MNKWRASCVRIVFKSLFIELKKDLAENKALIRPSLDIKKLLSARRRVNVSSIKRNIFGSNVVLSGSDKIIDSLTDILDFPACSKNEPELVFRIHQKSCDLQSEALATVGDLKVFDGKVAFSASPEYFVVINYSDQACLFVDCFYTPTRKRRLALKSPELLYKIKSSEYESIYAAIGRTFIFRCFYPILQLLNLINGRSFVHGSSLEFKNGDGILLTGWGGSGKTSLGSALLLSSSRFKFMSDDIALIDQEGLLYFNPLVAHIYPYNITGFNELENLLRRQSTTLSRLHWKIKRSLKGEKGVRRRVMPSKLFECYRDQAHLKKVLFFQRFDGTSFGIEEISCEELADLSSDIIAYEMKALIDLSLKMGALPKSLKDSQIRAYENFATLFFSLEEKLEIQRSFFRTVFSDVERYIVWVPQNSTPKDLRSATAELFSE
jgi:hypothetical protein